MNLIFIDKYHREIRLPQERIKHIYKHQEMQNKIYIIENTLKNPDYTEEDLYRREVLYYYKYVKEERKHLMVVVKLTNNHGFILTAYLVEK